MKLLVYLFLFSAVLAACGRKGPLIPPEALVPAAVDTLTVQQQGGDFLVSWSAPGKEQGGRPLRDLAGFQLLRHQLLPGEADCSACTDAWQLLVTVDLDLPVGVQQSGGRYLYRDTTVTAGAGQQYRILATSRSGGISRPATSPVKKIHPAPLPPALQAGLTPTGISLTLATPAPAGPDFAGFNLYRRTPQGVADPLPLNRAPITGPTWEDQLVEFGTSYRYRATTLIKTEGDLVESTPSPEVEILFVQQELR